MNTSQKTALNWIKIKIFIFLEIGTFLPISVKFFTETVNVRENLPTYHRQLSTHSIQQQKPKQNKFLLSVTAAILNGDKICQIKFESTILALIRLSLLSGFRGEYYEMKNVRHFIINALRVFP